MRKFYAMTREYDELFGTALDYVHYFGSKKERDEFVQKNENAFAITSKEYQRFINYRF